MAIILLGVSTSMALAQDPSGDTMMESDAMMTDGMMEDGMMEDGMMMDDSTMETDDSMMTPDMGM
jgi:hypothetical protein